MCPPPPAETLRGRSVRAKVGVGVVWTALAWAGLATAAPCDYWTGPADAPTPAGVNGGKVRHAKAVAALMAGAGTVVVDVSGAPRRPETLAPGAPWLPIPHRGLPGALWIPGAGEGNIAADVEDFYRTRLQQATGGNLRLPIVVYCHARCWLSWNASRRTVSYGYQNVIWFSDGVEGWTSAGFATSPLEPLGPGGGALDAAAPTDVSRRPTLAVLDLELSGDLGGQELTAEHDARLRIESLRLRHDLENTGLYQVVDNEPAMRTIEHLKAQQQYLHDCNGCDLDVARQLQADLILVAWVNRVSGLILTLTYEIHDVKSGQIASRKSYDFRGDSDNAWNHAIDYMVRDLKRGST